MSQIYVSWFLKSFWILNGCFALCSEMFIRTYNYRYPYVSVNIINSNHSNRFRECMEYNNSQKCILSLTSGGWSFLVYGVEQHNRSNSLGQNTLTYACHFIKEEDYNYDCYNKKCVVCSRTTSNRFCDGGSCGGSQWFQIAWQDYYEYFNDERLSMCRNNHMCSYYFESSTTLTKTTTPLTSGFTFGKTSKQTTLDLWNVTANYDRVRSLNTTLTSTFDNSQNTNTIIVITVVVCVCIVIVLVIIIYCIRRTMISKTYKEPQVMYASNVSTVENNNVTVFNDMAKNRKDTIINNTNEHLNENISHTYDEYDTTCTPQMHTCTKTYSAIDSSKCYTDKTIGNTRNKHISEQQKGVYQNIKPYTDTSLTKPYARLGEHLKVVEHDYNCLIPEHEDNQATNLNKTLDPSQQNSTNCTDLLGYSSTTKHVDLYSVTGESSNPYSLAKIVDS